MSAIPYGLASVKSFFQATFLTKAPLEDAAMNEPIIATPVQDENSSSFYTLVQRNWSRGYAKAGDVGKAILPVAISSIAIESTMMPSIGLASLLKAKAGNVLLATVLTHTVVGALILGATIGGMRMINMMRDGEIGQIAEREASASNGPTTLQGRISVARNAVRRGLQSFQDVAQACLPVGLASAALEVGSRPVLMVASLLKADSARVLATSMGIHVFVASLVIGSAAAAYTAYNQDSFRMASEGVD